MVSGSTRTPETLVPIHCFSNFVSLLVVMFTKTMAEETMITIVIRVSNVLDFLRFMLLTPSCRARSVIVFWRADSSCTAK